MSHTIYLVTNKLTGHRYVGATTLDVMRRFHQHAQNGPMSEDIRKQGAGTFTIDELEIGLTREAAFVREAELIHELKTHVPDGYNGQVRGGKYPGRGGPKNGNTNGRRHAVTQLTPDGVSIRSYNTVMGASIALGIHRGNIQRALVNPKYCAGGFKWKDALVGVSHGG